MSSLAYVPTLLSLCVWLTSAQAVLAAATAPQASIARIAEDAVTVGRDLDGDGDGDEVHIRLEVIEITEEVYPGGHVPFWVFAPVGRGMTPVARAPSPTIRVEEGDRVRVTLENTHYFPHTIHLHGTIHPNASDGVPDITQPAVNPGEAFTYEFVAKNPGTHWYHCHVQPDVHVEMGLVGMLIIEPNRPDNHFAHLIPGAGRIGGLAKATAEYYDREYSLVYTDIDERLHRIPAAVADPREIEKRMHRDYDTTRREANLFMLNGRAFPYTLRDTPIDVAPGNLHTHGHHPVITHLDGYAVPNAARITRDVVSIGPAQRVDLELRPGNDGTYASGPGVWLMHDHTERATTTNGINPGGDLNAIVYEGFRDESSGLPKVATSLERFFDAAFYRGDVPVFDPKIFHTSRADYGYGWSEEELGVALPEYPVRDRSAGSSPPHDPLKGHRALAESCDEPRGFQRVVVQGGARQAWSGAVFAFAPREIRAKRCEEVEIVFENTDAVRHALMIPGLNPMFMLEFTGPGTRTARFVTPDEDITLEFHCHVETHEKMGMHGRLVVGEGSAPTAHADARPAEQARELHEGVGVVVSVETRESRIVLDHEAIPDFMAPMVMSYVVTPVEILRGLKAGQKVRFTIDAKIRKVVAVEPIEK
jgi:FtsP/CotA-like multicopper oxidase with cupredoxin domain